MQPSRVICRDTLSSLRRIQLANKLRAITGWTHLHFDQNGALHFGNAQSATGSQTARTLMGQVVFGSSVVILEDASKRGHVAFSRVIPGKWNNHKANQETAYIVLIDFSDFEKLTGDREALEAFDLGWALLHEFDHIANLSVDAENLDNTGECEAHINQMRRESNLPERTRYFYTRYLTSAKNDFPTVYVRLPFERVNKTGKKERYWVVWDATSRWLRCCRSVRFEALMPFLSVYG